MSSEGRHYRAASGSQIRNHGQTTARFLSGEGHPCEMVFQVADVERILIGVTPLTRMGNEVNLRENDGEVRHIASGRTINLVRKGGVYVMPMHFLVDDPSAVDYVANGREPPEQGFTRPGP